MTDNTKSTNKNPEEQHLFFPEKKGLLNFPVVGIGASAGGLEALQEFFRAMPLKPGAAFVIVQHLSPDYKSLMDELLARYTRMVIHRVENEMKLEENHIYLIPPKMNMTISQGKLFLSEQQAMRTLNLPIDIFFRSLAVDQDKNAIGIILSGTGSDGTLGIRAIKEYGGITMVQDDRSAKFDGMPRSSISTGLVDYILPPAKLAEELLSYIKHPFIRQKGPIIEQENFNQSHLQKIIGTLKEAKGVDFFLYKENTILRRLEKRISINRFDNIEDYIIFLKNNNREINVLFNELLIGVTRFFRDEDAFIKLNKEVIEHLIKNSGSKQELRLWIPGCSTGEEAYSLAILLREAMQLNNCFPDVKIFATDLDTASLEYAGAGIYPESIASDVSPERIVQFFTKKDGGYQVKENIRSMVVFARHNLLKDPPFSKIDLISCRNLLIYLNNKAQQYVISAFYYALVDSGYLFLGSSESLGNMSDGFTTIDSKNKIYRQLKGYKPRQPQNFGLASDKQIEGDRKILTPYNRAVQTKSRLIEGLFDDIIADYMPPAVIVDESHEVVHTIRQVSKFISIPVGQASLNLMKMLPKELSIIVSSLIRRADKKGAQVMVEDISFGDDSHSTLTLSCKKILNNKSGGVFYAITFAEQPLKGELKAAVKKDTKDTNIQYRELISELEKELQQKSENLQAANEELETSNEELQSSNEELIASNEELQSTNEELQSVNEELYTVNSEHLRKIEELTELYADMDNLLKNTQIGTIFLDKELVIRKVNDVASRLTNVMSSDIGRPINHLSFRNLYPEFIQDVYNVSDNLVSKNTDIKDLAGNWYLMRILPYRTAENAINGIIITFLNITSLKESLQREKEAKDNFAEEMCNARKEIDFSERKCEMLFNTFTGGIVYQDKDGHIIGVNPAAEQILGVAAEEMQTRTSSSQEWKALRADKSEFPGEEHPAMQALKTGKIIKDVVMGVYNPVKEDYVWINITAIPLLDDEDDKPIQVYTVFHEINNGN